MSTRIITQVAGVLLFPAVSSYGAGGGTPQPATAYAPEGEPASEAAGAEATRDSALKPTPSGNAASASEPRQPATADASEPRPAAEAPPSDSAGGPVGVSGAAAGAGGSGTGGAPELPAEPKTKVDIGTSFKIRVKDPQDLSHAPAVTFTREGEKLLTVTSASEVVVFDAASKKELRRLRLPEKATDAAAIDPSGRWVIWVPEKGGLAVFDLESEKLAARVREAGAKWIAPAPAGDRVAVSRGKALEIRELPSLRLVRKLEGHQGEVTNLAWSADGSLLGSTAADGRVIVHEAATGARRYQTRKAEALYAVAFHPQDRFVAYGGKDKQVYQCDLAKGTEEVISKDQPYWITALGYSPDGTHLAVGDESCDIWLYDLAAKERVFHNKHHIECWLSSVAWAPDNERFLFGCRPNAHAGKPTVHMALVRAEAARSEEVQKARKAALEAVAEALAQAKDESTKKTLLASQAALTQEAKPEEGVPFGLLSPNIQFGQVLQGTAADQLLEVDPSEEGESVQVFFLSDRNSALGESQAAWNSAVPCTAQAVAVPLEKLPPKVRELAIAHRKALAKEMQELQSNFCLNEWRLERKQ